MLWNPNSIVPVILLLGFLHVGQIEAQIATFDVHLNDLLKLQKGLGWPSQMLVAKGQEGLMKLTTKLPHQETCTVTTPAGVVFDVYSPPNNRYEHWSDGCGLRVGQIESSDVGRWRLTATEGQVTITGWIEVSVHEDTTNYTASPISLKDGETHTEVELTSLDNSYCLVTQPFSDSTLVAGHCSVKLDKTTRAVQGNWDVLVGLPGQISELHFQRRVAVQAEHLDVGYIDDTTQHKIHMYCNILHTTKNVTFCRFQRTANAFGYNILEGLSDGTHSYYGKGFVAKECGLTIERPTAQDYGTWRCSVGSHSWVGNTLVEQPPMQALINVLPNQRSKQAQLYSETEEDRTIFVQEGLTFTIMCQAEVRLSYCWFLHPNGTQFSPLPQASDDQLFWYAGQSLQTGDCGITFTHANASDAGDWVCHMGVLNQLGVEHTDRVHVRVTGPLAAYKQQQEVVTGQSATLQCHTANGNRPLDYCRFLTPNHVGINIDSSVTETNPILDRFTFMPGRSLDYGDCALVITHVAPEDTGKWTCAARINGDLAESSDILELSMGSSRTRAPLSRAGIFGMSVGVIALIVVLAGVVWYKVGKPVPWNRNRSGISDRVTFDAMSVATASVSMPRTSNDSSSTASDISPSLGRLELDRSRPQISIAGM